MTRPLRFGIKTSPQDTTYDEILTVWKEADSIPAIEHAWLFDHFAPIHSAIDGPCLEGWTTLAALAAATTRLRLGMLVTGNTYRHPAILTKIAITTDVISGGRLDFGIGAGWSEYEHASMGIPLHQPGERIRRLNEACEIYKSLCTQHLTTYEGRYYQLKDARSEPKPVQKPYPPIVIGGSGEQLTLRVVARHADIWNLNIWPTPGSSTEIFDHKVSVLREHCAAVGRDPEEIELSVQFPVDFADLDATARTVQQFVDVGATHLILNLHPPFQAGMVTRLAEAVIPKINRTVA